MSARQVIINSRLCSVSNVQSRNRLSVSLATPIVAPRDHDIGLTVVDCQIPSTWYNVNASNNVISFLVKYGSFSTIVNLQIATGSYTIDSLITAWTNTTTPGLRNIPFTLNSVACTLGVTLKKTTINLITLLYTFTTTLTGSTWSFTAPFNSPLLGFNNVVIPNGATGSVVGNAVPNLYIRYYTLVSTLYTYSQIPTSGYTVPKTPICKIPFTASPGYTELFINPCPTPLKLADRIITNFDIAVLDDIGNDMNFNYYDWSCTLQLEFIPKLMINYNEEDHENFPCLE